MFSVTGHPARQMFWGDILLVGCCVFYLLWWVLAFKPTGAIKGMRSGWLLIPAFILGVAAMSLIIFGGVGALALGGSSFFSIRILVVLGVISYVVLLVVTRLAFHRQVTTELFLIVGWTVLVFLESNALYGMGLVTRNGAIGLFAAAIVVAALSMVCYILYYGLDERKGYVDGMIPLILAAGYMSVLAVIIARGASASIG